MNAVNMRDFYFKRLFEAVIHIIIVISKKNNNNV